MAIVINGSGTVTGLSVGGLPDGTVDAGTLATNSVDSAELVDGSIDSSHLASGVGGVAGISSSADATAMTITSAEKIGIGETAPLGQLHIKEQDSGVSSISSNGDQLVLENSGHCGMHILSGTSSDGILYFGDSGGSGMGQLKYQHGSNQFVFETNQSGAFTITSDGRGLSQFTAKAWGQFDFSNMSINDSHNFSSITDISTGRGRPNFTNAMGNSSYAIATTQAESYISGHSNLTTGNFSLYTYDTNGTKVDTDKVMAIVFGD